VGVEITIDDNGTGVPEEERAAVFKRVHPRVDGIAFRLGPRAGTGGPAGRTTRRHRVAEGQPAGRRATTAAATRSTTSQRGKTGLTGLVSSNEPRAGKANGRGSGPPSILNG